MSLIGSAGRVEHEPEAKCDRNFRADRLEECHRPATCEIVYFFISAGGGPPPLLCMRPAIALRAAGEAPWNSGTTLCRGQVPRWRARAPHGQRAIHQSVPHI